MIKNYAKVFFIALPLLVAFDASWVGVIAGSFYRHYLGDILAPNVNYLAAALFYISYTAALLYFAILPAITEKSFTSAFIRGAALGAACYMTYDFTNLATLPIWPWMVVLLDIAWGAIMTACVSSLTYLLALKLFDVTSSTPAL